jgi:polyisoprenoid-binding protein YceI
MRTNNILTALLVVAAATAASAQSPQGVPLQLAPGSWVTIKGTSTLHGFTCKTDKLEAYIDVDPAYRIKQLTEVSHPIVQTRVVIQVKSLKCGEGKMDENMYGTLKAKENPTISYVLSTYELSGTASPTGFAANTSGELTIAGKANPVTMTIKAEKGADGAASATGSYTLLMTDFGIKPPRFMFGTLRVGNQIVVSFSIKASAQTVAMLSGSTVAAP